jgi:hypothetical protein
MLPITSGSGVRPPVSLMADLAGCARRLVAFLLHAVTAPVAVPG